MRKIKSYQPHLLSKKGATRDVSNEQIENEYKDFNKNNNNNLGKFNSFSINL